MTTDAQRARARDIGAGKVPDVPLATQLTDSSGGTAGDTIAAIGGTYSQTEVRNAVASLAAKVNQLLQLLGG